MTGSNFMHDSVVEFDDVARTTAYIGPTELSVIIPASDMASAGVHDIAVYNPGPGGGDSNTQTFTVNNPVPTTASIDPISKNAGDPGFTLTVNGTGFIPSSVVRIDGIDRLTGYVSPAELTADILASDLTGPANFSIDVYNAGPGGGTSNFQSFIVQSTAEIRGPMSAIPIAIRLLRLQEEELENARLAEMRSPPPTAAPAAPQVPSAPRIVDPSFSIGTCDGFACTVTVSFNYRLTPSNDEFYLLDSDQVRMPSIVSPITEGTYSATFRYRQNSEVKISICEASTSDKNPCINASTWTPSYISPYDLRVATAKTGAQYRVSVNVPSINNMNVGKSGVRVEVFDLLLQKVSPSAAAIPLFAQTVTYPTSFQYDLVSGRYLVQMTPINAEGEAGDPIRQAFTLGNVNVQATPTVEATVSRIKIRLTDLITQLITILSAQLLKA